MKRIWIWVVLASPALWAESRLPDRRIQGTQPQSHVAATVKGPSLELLSFPEFKALSSSEQLEYVKDLDSFLSALEKNGAGLSPATARLPEILRELLVPYVLPEAQAQGRSRCSYAFSAKNKDGTWLVCMERGTREICSNEANTPEDKTLFKNISGHPSCNSQFQQAKQEVEGELNKIKLRQEGLNILKTELVNEKIRAAAAADIEAVAIDKKAQHQSRDQKISEEIKENSGGTDNSPSDFACIYAGNIVKKNQKAKKKCSPPSSVTLKIDGKSETLLCPSSQEDKKQGNVVICNPYIYGYGQKLGPRSQEPANKEPVCVQRSPKASELCTKAALKSGARTADAVELLRQNEEEYRNIKTTIERVCANPGDLKRSPKSTKDIEETCAVFQDRFARYEATRDGTCRRGCGGGYSTGTQ